MNGTLSPVPVRAQPQAVDGPQQEVLVLAGGTRGQGTSMLAALLGILASADGARVLLVDAASPHSISGMLGIGGADAPFDAADAAPLDGPRLVPVSESLSLLSLDEPVAPDAQEAWQRRARIRWMAPLYLDFDLVVVDAGARLETVVAVCGSAPARVVAVTTSNRVAVTTSYALVKALGARLPHVPVEVLINCASPTSGMRVFQELEQAVRLFLHSSLPYAGTVPEDHALREAVRAGMPVHHAPIDSPVVTAVYQLGLRLRRELSFASHAVSVPLSSWR